MYVTQQHFRTSSKKLTVKQQFRGKYNKKLTLILKLHSVLHFTMGEDNFFFQSEAFRQVLSLYEETVRNSFANLIVSAFICGFISIG